MDMKLKEGITNMIRTNQPDLILNLIFKIN
jgi:hypothetical protein